MSDSDNNNSEVASDVDQESSYEAKRRERHPENFDQSNKLKLNKFHRYDIQKKKKRTTTSKKKIRDLERMLEKLGDRMPEDVKEAKRRELKELKKGEKSKKEAEKFESRYKKVKFFEKKKIIRRLERAEKEMTEDGVSEERKQELIVEKQKNKNYLTYVNHFPDNQKYLSLFPTGPDAEKSKAQRDEMMVKILKSVEVRAKLREKELLEMDKPE